jgi:type I restriction enzyme S subunit
MSGASGRQRADRNVIESVQVPAPPLPVQRKIASVLAAYDELIENNLRRIAILEEMAQAVYREWFVNFRFPGHEDVGLVDSPLGPIPEGWQPATVEDAIELNPRVRLPRDEELRFVPMSSLIEGSMVIDGYETRIGPSGSQFRNGDTLLARTTPSLENGKTGFVQFLAEGEVACGSTEFIVMRSRTLTPEYVYLFARTDDFRAVAVKSMVGASGRQRVQESSISKYLFAHPDSTTLQRFQDVVSPMFRLVQNLVDQNANLRATRDLLLPKLVSGEIDVSDLDIDTEWLAS